LNVADCCGTPDADKELREFRERFGRIVASSFHFHYARLIEAIYCLERLQQLLENPAILDRHVRARAEVNAAEGIGVAEAPRGILIHHYKVDENGAIRWANLIIATGHNNLAINRSIEQVSKYFVKANRLEEGMLNRVSAVVRAYDPCLSCSTHASGIVPMRIELVGRAENCSMRYRVACDGVLVIGYGSELRGDDAAGPTAARRLRSTGLSALDVHQLTPEIAERSAAARVVFFLMPTPV